MSSKDQAAQRRVVLIEDDPDHAEIMCFFILEVMPDALIERLEDGERALHRVDEIGSGPQQPLPWIILLDINLPKFDGHEVLARIRSYERLCPVPVIICSTSEADCDVRRALELGANSYLTKPLTNEGFEELVHKTLGFWSMSSHETALGRRDTNRAWGTS